MAGARARAGQLSAWPRRLPGRRARVRWQLDRSHAELKVYMRSGNGKGPGREHTMYYYEPVVGHHTHMLSTTTSAAAATASAAAVAVQTRWEPSDIDTATCQACGRADNESCMLLCDQCNAGCHTYCCKPALSSIPNGDWYCKQCAQPVHSPQAPSAAACNFLLQAQAGAREAALDGAVPSNIGWYGRGGQAGHTEPGRSPQDSRSTTAWGAAAVLE
jgi:hypothetical protein